MQASQAPASPGTHTLGKYRLIAQLGHGGMAEVFLAVVQGPGGFNKLVVIKLIRPQLAEDPDFLGMFLDEARLAARVSHPNVVQTNEVGQDGARFFIAMEYLDGQPLNRLIHRMQRKPTSSESIADSKSRSLPLAIHLKIISEVLSGLHHAHELTDYDGTPLHVVHRDVTPHNIFVTYEGQVKVVDFGIAKALDSTSQTRNGVLKGKVAYMAPEQAQGERVDRRADVFSVGVLLWEAATGKRLWKGVPDITILQRLATDEVPTPRSVKPSVPKRLEAIILKALAHRRTDRYASALDLQSAIEDFIDSMGERVSTRDIAKLLTTTFEMDRARVKGIIDEQLRAPGFAAPPALILTATAANLPLVDPQLNPAAVLSARHSRDGPQTRVESNRSISSSGSSSRSVSSSGSSNRSASYPGPSMLFTHSGAPLASVASEKRRLGTVVVLVLAISLVVGVGIWLFAHRPSALATDPTAKATTSAVPPPAPVEVELNITVTPAEAKIFLDDNPLPNPFKGKLPSDAGKHQLRVEADGFIRQNRQVSLERAVDIELVLQKDTSAGEKPPDLAPPPSRPSPGERSRPADPDDPYR
jgi:serine/threonine protein kinase